MSATSDSPNRQTSDLLKHVVETHDRDVISVAEIKESLSERGFGVLMAIAALPLCLPFPAPPGYTTFFSIPLFILATQMIFGAHSPWLPKWIERKEISRAKLAKFFDKAVPLLQKIERLLKPRMINGNVGSWEKLIGISSFIFAASIAIPLPLTNLPPGYGILIMSLGLLSKDGLTILIGLVVGIIGLIITAFTLVLSWHIVKGWFGVGEDDTQSLLMTIAPVFG